MRGEAAETSHTEYECYVCRNRMVDPARPVCDRCGADMMNISRARDL